MSPQNLSSLSTLPIELAYRIFDHLKPYDILISAYSVFTRWNDIIDTYQPFQRSPCPFTTRPIFNSADPDPGKILFGDSGADLDSGTSLCSDGQDPD